jgi:uncharacterized membrane protein
MVSDDRSKVRISDIVSFSDAIFAFSITFMALSIQFPDQTNNLTQSEIISKILELRPQFEVYVVSFFVVGIYWIAYHFVFNHIIDSHSTRTWINLLFLFFITLISFTTSLLIRYGNYSIVFILYSAVLAITGTLLSLIWIHAKVTNHIDKELNETNIMNITLESIVPPIIFMLSIPVFFINANIAHYFWLLIIPSKVIIRKRYPYNNSSLS